MIALGVSGGVKPGEAVGAKPDPRGLPFVQEALARIEKGGFPEAVARIGALVGRFAGSIPLTRLELGEKIVSQDEVLSKLTDDERRALTSDASVMALLEPERTLHALPLLLPGKADRERAMFFLEYGRKMDGITKEQIDMIDRIIQLIKPEASGDKPAGAGRKKASAK
jgi:hypothetical protein